MGMGLAPQCGTHQNGPPPFSLSPYSLGSLLPSSLFLSLFLLVIPFSLLSSLPSFLYTILYWVQQSIPRKKGFFYWEDNTFSHYSQIGQILGVMTRLQEVNMTMLSLADAQVSQGYSHVSKKTFFASCAKVSFMKTSYTCRKFLHFGKSGKIFTQVIPHCLISTLTS